MSEIQIKNSCDMLGYLMRSADVNSNGLGVGLSVSKLLVEHNQGNLQINSDGSQKGTIV